MMCHYVARIRLAASDSIAQARATFQLPLLRVRQERFYFRMCILNCGSNLSILGTSLFLCRLRMLIIITSGEHTSGSLDIENKSTGSAARASSICPFLVSYSLDRRSKPRSLEFELYWVACDECFPLRLYKLSVSETLTASLELGLKLEVLEVS